MRTFALLVFAIVACATAEIAFPGRAIYHSGWFNVMLVVFAVLLGYAVRPLVRKNSGRDRGGIIAIALGAMLVIFATVISGLLAPDDRTIVGSPGSQVPVSELGAALVFPVGLDQPVQLGTTPIGSWRYVGSSILQAIPRTVVGVEARDMNGGALTITQPSGGAFLSPVLMMQSQQTIAGMSLPVDSFAVPAMHRIVHAMVFSARQAAQMRGLGGVAVPAVLFAVDDEADRPLLHGLSLTQTDETVVDGGLMLRGSVFSYPAIEVMAAPSLLFMSVGMLAIVAGSILLFWRRRSEGQQLAREPLP